MRITETNHTDLVDWALGWEAGSHGVGERPEESGLQERTSDLWVAQRASGPGTQGWLVSLGAQDSVPKRPALCIVLDCLKQNKRKKPVLFLLGRGAS